MVSASLFGSGTSSMNQPLAQFLPAAIAWTAIAVSCFHALVPLSNTRSQQSSFLDRKSQLPRLFQNRYFDASLIFLFHALVSANSHVNTWALPLTAIVVCFTAQNSANLDSNLANLSQLISRWRLSFKYNDLESLKPVVWLAACVLTIVTAFLSGSTYNEFAVGVFVFLIGFSVYTYVPESILRSDYTTSQELQRHILLPIALQSIACAVVVWLVFGGYVLALGSIALYTISNAAKGLAILLSVTEGTTLPVLAALSMGAVLQASVGPLAGSSLVSGVLLVGLAAQLVLSLPKAADKRRNFWVYVAAPLLAVSILEILASMSQPKSGQSYSTHPIQTIHEAHLADFQRKLSRQSETAAQATQEYIRRYGRKPPPKFESWFEVAKEQNFQLVDEFDTIMSSIIPFWGLESKHLKNRMDTAGDGYGITTVRFRNHENITFEPEHYHVPIIIDWLAPYMKHNLLPDFDFLINVLDEPRVNAPFEVARAASDHAYTSTKSSYGSVPITWVEVSRHNLKDDIAPSCPPSIDLRTVDNLPLPFITNLTTAKDFCHNPAFFANHGFFQAPETLVITHNLLPVLSQCKPERFNDIIYPSPYYTVLDDFQWIEDKDDVIWSAKHDDLYWSGSSTGGRSTMENWRTLHRQRLALLSTTDSSAPLQLLEPSSLTSHGWAPFQTTWEGIKSLLRIRLNRVVQCDPGACDAMEDAFPLVGTSDPVSESVESKYSLDMDGNAFTGRFYRLLKSRSCVLKMSVFKEWHDDHLMPWVHYIPVTPSFDELGEIMRYLTQDAKGQEMGEFIANEGRTWSNKVLRKTDLEIVMLRVLMEVARMIQTDD